MQQHDKSKADLVADDNEADNEKVSESSDGIRKHAKQILETYNFRLKKVGSAPFQIRLNIFLTFVKHASLEADVYDQL